VLQTGIYEHPEWFEGLDKEARFEEVQAKLAKDDPDKPEDQKSHCAAPCKDPAAAKRHKGVPGSALDLPVPGPYAERQELEFYMFRAQGDEDYPLENVDTGDLAGVMWYLHNEIVVAVGKSRKYSVTRIRRFRVKVKTTWAYYNSHRRQFGSFVAFDSGHCTVPGCDQIWKRFGALPGCQHVDTERLRAAYASDTKTFIGEGCTGHECHPPVWYSLPGPCPNHNIQEKTEECKRDLPGGLCDAVTGDRDCTYSVEDAGEVGLDVVTGISDYAQFFEDGGIEYSERRDTGVHNSFWEGKKDEDKCRERVESVKRLFDEKYPDMPKCDDLPGPPCDTDGYYEGELEASLDEWPVYEDGPVEVGTFGAQALDADGVATKSSAANEKGSGAESKSTSSKSTSSGADRSTTRATTTPEASKAKDTVVDDGRPHSLNTQESTGEEDTLPSDATFTVTLDHSNKEILGLAFTMVDEGIVVDGVTGGLFGKWNENNPDHRVKGGDLIVAVNGVRGSSLKLADQLRQPRELKVELQTLEPYRSGAVAVGARWPALMLLAVAALAPAGPAGDGGATEVGAGAGVLGA